MSERTARVWIINLVLILVLGTSIGCAERQTEIKAPPETKNWVNPTRATSESLATGKDLYIKYCARCHGLSGDGNGEEGKELEPKPTSFTNPKIQAQTDGELFWKITHREGPMGGWNKRLNDEDRWHLVNFLRIFGQLR